MYIVLRGFMLACTHLPGLDVVEFVAIFVDEIAVETLVDATDPTRGA